MTIADPTSRTSDSEAIVHLTELPELGATRRLSLPRSSERTLPNGLTVIAIRRPAVPLVELRLRIPFAKAHLARGDVLSQTIFSGTPTRDTVQIAAELQSVGGGLGASADPDRLLISGNALSSGLSTSWIAAITGTFSADSTSSTERKEGSIESRASTSPIAEARESSSAAWSTDRLEARRSGSVPTTATGPTSEVLATWVPPSA